MTHDEMIAVILAQQDGKEIEAMSLESGLAWQLRKDTETCAWIPVIGSAVGFAFDRFLYRIKPEPPKPREWWLAVDSDGAVLKVCDQQVENPNFIPRVHVREVLPDEEGKA